MKGVNSFTNFMLEKVYKAIKIPNAKKKGLRRSK